MADALTTLVQSAASLAKLATDLVTASDTAKRNAQLIEFQSALIGLQSLVASVQQENATLIRGKRDAEEEVKRMKDWETQKERYQLAAPNTGSFVYALKQAKSEGEPPHYLCASCFKQGKASIVNDMPSKRRSHDHAWACPVCGSEALNGYSGPAPVHYAEDIKQ